MIKTIVVALVLCIIHLHLVAHTVIVVIRKSKRACSAFVDNYSR